MSDGEIRIPGCTVGVAGAYDVVVCGGGMAGIGAGFAAARSGAKTALVEPYEVLGGLGSSGGVGNFCAGRNGLDAQGRVFDDVIDGLRAYGAYGKENGWHERVNERWETPNNAFDHNVLPLVLQEMAVSCGVDVMYATSAVGVVMDDARVDAVLVHNRSLTQALGAKVVVDATGEGVVARHAGAHELPDDPQFPNVIQPSFMVFLRKTEKEHAQPVPGPRHYTGDATPEYSIWREPDGRIGLKLKLFDVDTYDTGTGEGFIRALVAMRSRIPEAVRHFQENHDPTYAFDYAAPMLGLREGRRVEGDYVLTIDDARAGTRFDDGVAYGTFTVDANRTREKLPPYQIPYRSLVAKGVENCLVPGRGFSSDRLTLSSA